MVKKYATGNVSKSIHEQVDSIEGIFGTGLDLQKGTNVIITGGTGILPFLDLFDLLLKKAICLAAGNINTDIDLDVYGIGYATILPSVKVKLFASFTSFEELNNYQWLVDLHIISKNHKLGLFEMHVRLPEGQTAVSEIAQFQERIG